MGTARLEPPPQTPTTLPMGEIDPAYVKRGAMIGRFVVLDQLGAGGMGIVTAAYDPELDRKVAIKVLRPYPGRDSLTVEQRVRALREAQAMARLSHPNVITVYDVGALDQTVFIAMELIDGETLRGRLAALPRGPGRWRRVLELLVPAGRGLAAAHAAGLVHRDFKPDNVLCGKDGRVCVTDFGLVAPVSSSGDDGGSPTPTRAGVAVTRAGTVLGTPRYMAPEQRLGRPADARADQYAYCVALFEALGGELNASAEATVPDSVDASPPDRERPADVPLWLHRAVVRGLAPSVAGRYPSMEALLAELTRDRARRIRRTVVIVGTVAIAAGTLFAVERATTPAAGEQPCRVAGAKVDATWNSAVAARIHDALASSGKPYAESTWNEVYRVLQGYSRELTSAHIEACEATHVRHVQSEPALDLRVQCLERRRSALAAATSQLTRPDTIDRADELLRDLPSIVDCADGVRLAAPLAMPDDSDAQARIAAARAKVDESRAYLLGGRPHDAVRVAGEAVGEAHAADYPPVLAEALHALGRAQDDVGSSELAFDTLRQAAAAADAARDDQIKADVWTRLVFVASESLGKWTEAEAWVPLARVAIERLGSDRRREAALLRVQGMIAFHLGKYDLARTRHEAALSALVEVQGPEHLEVADSHNSLALTLRALGDRDGAIAEHRRALAIRIRLGETHPDVADSRTNLGIVLRDAGRYAEALVEQERALAARIAVFGNDHMEVANARNNRAMVLLDLDRIAEAVTEWQTVYEIRKTRMSGDHPLLAATHNNLGLALDRSGRHREGIEHLRVALAMRERLLPSGHVEIGMTRGNLGRALLAAGETAAGVNELTAAAELFEKTLGPEHPQVSYWLGELGTELAYAGRGREAVRPCERSLEVALRSSGDDSIDAAYARLCVGRARLLIGDAKTAERELERALPVFEASEEVAEDVTETRTLLTRAKAKTARAR